MKKNLLLVLVFVSTLGFSQQVLKRITDTPTETIVELYACANGTSNSNVIGSLNIGSGSDSQGGFTFNYNNISLQASTNQNFYFQESNDAICNTTLSVTSITLYSTRNLYTDELHNPPLTPSLDIPNAKWSNDFDTNGDGIRDILKSKFNIPKFQANGSPVPTNLYAACRSRTTKSSANGSTLTGQRSVILKFDGNTWVLQSLWNGSSIPFIQDVCNNLSVLESEINKSTIIIYPNPSNNFITIQNEENPTENFDYKIVDLTGRIIKSGNSKFNKQLNIESLTSGNYIIQIETENGEKFTEKLIKN